jgi:pilus assembly protein CpaB
MKGSRALIVLFLAMVSGLAAMLVGAQWMTNRSDTGGKKMMIAARDISLGSPIDATMLEEISWHSETLPAGAYSDTKELVGRVVKTTLLRGEPILETRLAPIGTKGGLSAVIPEGKRAITVKVNEVIGVAGFALPGNFVDVMVNAQDETKNSVSKIVLDRILVLAIAQEAGRDDTKPKVVSAVTLEVTPGQAEILDLARSIGNLSLVLRNQVDQADAATVGTRTADLLKLKQVAVEAPPPAAPPRRVVAQRPVVVPPAPPTTVVTAIAPAPVIIEERPRVEVIRGVQRGATEL